MVQERFAAIGPPMVDKLGVATEGSTIPAAQTSSSIAILAPGYTRWGKEGPGQQWLLLNTGNNALVFMRVRGLCMIHNLR